MKDRTDITILSIIVGLILAIVIAYVAGYSGVNEHPSQQYTRSEFGTPWKDVDGNGCDTRNDVLFAQLEQRVRDTDGCTVIAGVVRDKYTNDELPFEKGAAFPIDHIVPLSEAWKSGANKWSFDERERFANDPANLQVTQRSVNASKSDKDIANWVPPYGECDYLAKYVSVKDKYLLSYDMAEVEKINRMRTLCK